MNAACNINIRIMKDGSSLVSENGAAMIIKKEKVLENDDNDNDTPGRS